MISEQLASRLYGRYLPSVGVGNEVQHQYYDDGVYSTLKRESIAGDAAIVDLGCGSGAKLDSLRCMGFVNLSGCDALVDAAQFQRLELVATDMATFLMQLGDGTVDVIIMHDVAEHLEIDDLVDVLAQCRRVLAATGLLLLRAPNAASPFGAFYQYGDLTHRCALSEVSLRQAADLVGLDLVAFKGETLSRRGFGRSRRYQLAILTPLGRLVLRMLSVLIYKANVELGPNFLAVLVKSGRSK